MADFYRFSLLSNNKDKPYILVKHALAEIYRKCHPPLKFLSVQCVRAAVSANGKTNSKSTWIFLSVSPERKKEKNALQTPNFQTEFSLKENETLKAELESSENQIQNPFSFEQSLYILFLFSF